MGARRLDKLEALKREIEAAVPGAKIVVKQCDVTKRADHVALLAAAQVRATNPVCCPRAQPQQELGFVDVLVLNAGVMPLSLIKNARVDEWFVFACGGFSMWLTGRWAGIG